MLEYEIVWYKEAIDNVRDIRSFIARNSEFYADKVAQKIFETTLPLKQDQYLGPEEQGLRSFQNRHRYLVCSHYKIIYWIFENKVFIAAVFDTRQKPAKLKKIVKKRRPT